MLFELSFAHLKGKLGERWPRGQGYLSTSTITGESSPKYQQPFPNLPKRTMEGKRSIGRSSAWFFSPLRPKKGALLSPQTIGWKQPREAISTQLVAGLPGSPVKQHQTQWGNCGHHFLGQCQRNLRLLPLLIHLHHWWQPRTKLTTGENHTKGNTFGPEKCPSGHKSGLNITVITQTEIISANYKIIFM